MTNKEAIKYLIAPTATSTKPSAEYLKQKEAYELAVKALEEVKRMTNAEKYKEVFGLEVDPSMCPSKECVNCPCRPNIIKDEFCSDGSTYEWWNKDYKE